MLCGLIIASWFGVGAWKGWGYCLVTDLHWRLLRRMGSNVPPFGYMPMLWQRFTGRVEDAGRVDRVTEWVFYFLVAASLWVNRSWLGSLL
jgi:hypothetical protein